MITDLAKSEQFFSTLDFVKFKVTEQFKVGKTQCALKSFLLLFIFNVCLQRTGIASQSPNIAHRTYYLLKQDFTLESRFLFDN